MDSNDIGGSDAVARIRPEDNLIKRADVQRIMGGISVSSLYDDAELMALKVNLMAGDSRPRAVRWIEREIHDLRARRVARSEEHAVGVRTQAEARRERRRERDRQRTATAAT